MVRPFIAALTSAVAVLAGSASLVCAQDNYPSKPIRVIVPEVVGSAADLMATDHRRSGSERRSASR